MKTVLVHYREWELAPHAMMNDEYLDKSKIVKVKDLEELNDMFSNIVKVELIENNENRTKTI